MECRWIQGALGGIYVDSGNTWQNKVGFTEHLVEYRWIHGTLGEIYVH
jgi:hypothetical protein